MSKHPPLLWSQLRDFINITINVQDAQNVKIEIVDFATSSGNTSSLKISLSSPSGEQFTCDLILFSAVEAALSSQEIKPRGVHITLSKRKGNSDSWFWPRLIQTKAKNPNITIDWSNWKDEDDLEKMPGSGLHQPAASSSAQHQQSKNNNNNNSNYDSLFSGIDGHDTGGLHMDSTEIQNTLAALRQQQIEMKEAQLRTNSQNGGGGVDLTEKEKRKLMAELRGAKKEDDLMKSVPAFGSAKDQMTKTQQDEESDNGDDDELPPLV